MTPEFSYFTMPLSAIMCAWHNSFPLLIAISMWIVFRPGRTGRLRLRSPPPSGPGQRGGLFGSVVWCGQCFEASELLQSEWDLAVDLDYWDYGLEWQIAVDYGRQIFHHFSGTCTPKILHPTSQNLPYKTWSEDVWSSSWAWWIQHPMGCPWDATGGDQMSPADLPYKVNPPGLGLGFGSRMGRWVTDYMIDDICNRRMYSYNMSEHDKA